MGTSLGSEGCSLEFSRNVGRVNAWGDGGVEGGWRSAHESILEGEVREWKKTLCLLQNGRKHFVYCTRFHRPSPDNEQTVNVTILSQHVLLSQCKMT